MARPTNLRLLAVMGALAIAAFMLALMATHKPAQATLPGANGKIAFVAVDNSSDETWSNIYTMNPDGSGLWGMNGTGGDRSPAWSPDGQRMAFTAYDWIYVVNADGSGQERIMPDGYDPQWLPNGQKISFVRHEEGSSQMDLYVMRPDGSDVEKLGSFPIGAGGYGWSYTWSPNSRKIAFACTSRPYDKTDFEICVMNADGSDLKRLTCNRSDDEYPDWSPDGREIVFSRYHKGCDGGPCQQIHVKNVAGDKARRLTDTPSYTWNFDPVWSPDGRKVAFKRSGSKPGIYVMKADGSKEHQVLDYYEFGWGFDDLAWQPL